MIEQDCRPRSPSWLLGLAIFAGCVGLGSPAFADFVDTTTTATTGTTTSTDTTVVNDPLHVYFPGFVDNGTNTPTSTYPANFGFTVSPGPASGSDFIIDVLVPNNEASYVANYAINGTSSDQSQLPVTISTAATPVLGPAWTSGNLATYLGLSASPSNPIGAFDCQPAGVCANAYDPGLTGFYVYQADLGSAYLQDPSNPNQSPILSIGANLPPGSYIVAFLNEGTANAPNWIATASSGALLYTAMAAREPSSLALLAAAMLGLAMVRRSRRAV